VGWGTNTAQHTTAKQVVHNTNMGSATTNSPRHRVHIQHVQVGEAPLAVPAPKDVQAVANKVAAVGSAGSGDGLGVVRTLGLGLEPRLLENGGKVNNKPHKRQLRTQPVGQHGTRNHGTSLGNATKQECIVHTGRGRGRGSRVGAIQCQAVCGERPIAKPRVGWCPPTLHKETRKSSRPMHPCSPPPPCPPTAFVQGGHRVEC
jgi:uncharacterized protein (DUF736 family)